RVDVGAVAGDHALALEPAEALGDGRRGQPDAAAELGEADARIRSQFLKQASVGGVEQAVLASIHSHLVQDTCDRPWRNGVWRGTLWGMLERLAGKAPPHATFMVSAVFHYLGPSFAVLLFARVDVLGVAWLRIASAAVVFAVWRRPWHAFR